MKICAIHQPNFFPWLGFFNKIARTDTFVFLNQVDYEKSGNSMQCYTNRVAVLRAGKPVWMHCPVIREHGPQAINNVRINNATNWRKERIDLLDQCYRNAPFYKEVSGFVFELINYEEEYLAEYNMAAITSILDKLDIRTQLYRQDELYTEFHSTNLLIEIVEKIGCDGYMYGGGGNKYQDEKLFHEHNIYICPQNFVVQEYKQSDNVFVGGLSVLDALFFCGFDGTRELIMRQKG